MTGCPDFLSCDWGTTSFRLRWVAGPERQVVREICESAGIRSLQAARNSAANEAARAEVFASFLREKLAALLADESPPRQRLPLVISGMASSSVGWRELPYAQAPFSLDGRGLHAEELRWNHPDWIGPTYLISGVATEHEMMRGEETEILGLMGEPTLAALRKGCVLVLPGTHSKHVSVKNESVVGWTTFMTGELFEVLGQQSLLRASIDPEARTASDSFSTSEGAAFREGVQWAQDHGLAGGLFRVRTRVVLGRRPLAENTWFFSGLLIGAELAALSGATHKRPIVLAATRRLAEPYALAMEIVAGQAISWVQIPPEQVERAGIAAHALFLQGKISGTSQRSITTTS